MLPEVVEQLRTRTDALHALARRIHQLDTAGRAPTAAGGASARVDLPCDVQLIDHTGYTTALLDEAHDPALIVPGQLILAGDDQEPAFAEVINVVGEDPAIVHLDIAPGPPGRYLAAAVRCGLLPNPWASRI